MNAGLPPARATGLAAALCHGGREQAMAERSFAKEVQALKLGEGEIFEGEGILAVTKAALQAGVSYVGGYQGSPVSHLVDVLSES
jgi:indolepyruvate ferredoxin oxidoreductase alpha subunit